MIVIQFELSKATKPGLILADMKASKKQLFKIKFSDACGISFFIMDAYDSESIKSLLYNYMGTNLKCLSEGKKAKPKDIEGAKCRGEYVRYYVVSC
jgi:hypothetical protein